MRKKVALLAQSSIICTRRSFQPQKPAPHLVGKLAFSSEGKRNDLRIIHLFWDRGAAALLVVVVALARLHDNIACCDEVIPN